MFVISFYRKSKYHSLILYVLETGNPHAPILDYRGGKDVIRVVIFSSKIQKKKFMIMFKKAIAVGYHFSSGFCR